MSSRLYANLSLGSSEITSSNSGKKSSNLNINYESTLRPLKSNKLTHIFAGKEHNITNDAFNKIDLVVENNSISKKVTNVNMEFPLSFHSNKNMNTITDINPPRSLCAHIPQSNEIQSKITSSESLAKDFKERTNRDDANNSETCVNYHSDTDYLQRSSSCYQINQVCIFFQLNRKLYYSCKVVIHKQNLHLKSEFAKI